MPGLRDTAKADAKSILNDGVHGFGWPITVTDPEGTVGNLTGFSNDVAEVIDPDTGVAVSGRIASIALVIQDIIDEGLAGLPKNIADKTKKPWIVEFDDINGNPFTFKVQHSNPDRTLGIITCVLEFYEKC